MKTYTLPGKELGFEEDRVYKIVDRIPHRVFKGFAAYQSKEMWGEASDFVLKECIVEGPIPTKKGGWKQGPLTDEYLNSNECSGIEMNILTEMIFEDFPDFNIKMQQDLKKKARKS